MFQIGIIYHCGYCPILVLIFPRWETYLFMLILLFSIAVQDVRGIKR